MANNTSLLSNIKRMSGISENHKPYDVVRARSEPYDVIHTSIEPKEISKNNPLQERIDINISNKSSTLEYLNAGGIDAKKINPQLNSTDFNEALKYLQPKELKAGESLTVQDNKKVTYEELAKVAKDVENVTTKDHEFDKMPKIFIFQSPPPENSRGALIYNHIKGDFPLNNLTYIIDKDSVLINQQFVDTLSKDELKGLFAHEIGHRTNYNGKISRVFNPDKFEHSIRNSSLGGDFTEHCGISLNNDKTLQNLGITYKKDDSAKGYISSRSYITAQHNKECTEDIKEIISEEKRAISSIQDKNEKIGRKHEFTADTYPALAGYGGGLVNLLQKHPEKESLTHPSSDERIKRIEDIQKDPKTAKERLEAAINDFQKYASSPTSVDNGEKTPNVAPAPNQPSDLRR
ncbi:MAG: hypothetical protein ABL857_07885 [Rickettsiales bacterium]